MIQVGSRLWVQLRAGSFGPLRSFQFNLREFGGGLGDVGTLFPLLVAAALVNGMNAQVMVLGAGIFYIVSSLYYRLPLPVQPLKAALAIAIALGLPGSTIGAAGILMAVIVLFLAATNLVTVIARWFPSPVVKGIQLSVGLLLVQKGAELMIKPVQVPAGAAFSSLNGVIPLGLLIGVASLLVFAFVQKSKAVPASLAVLGLGVGLGVFFGPDVPWDRGGARLSGLAWPGTADFAAAFFLLVIPQLPLTLGNSVVATADAAATYYGPEARRVTPRALAAGIGVANLAAGVVGALPMCQGSGGVTAHYKLGARTGGATLMVGGLLAAVALVAGGALLPAMGVIPLSVLGALLMVVGIYHAFLARDLDSRFSVAVAFSVAGLSLLAGNLAVGFGAGIAMHYGFKGLGLVRPALAPQR